MSTIGDRMNSGKIIIIKEDGRIYEHDIDKKTIKEISEKEYKKKNKVKINK